MGFYFQQRHSFERGTADFGWLKSKHTFSFGQYYDAQHIQFANLRVINDDVVKGGYGFALHPHANAEIFSYVLEGALEHKDSLGYGSVVKAGGVQFMSAGTGIYHSEFNPSSSESMRFLQVWLMPDQKNTPPKYENKVILPEEKSGKLALFLSADGREGSIKTQANASVYCATLHAKQRIEINYPNPVKAWVQVARGALVVNEHALNEGDGLAIEGWGDLIFERGQQAEFLYFELN